MNKEDEFVPEYFNWTTMEKQRENVEKLENITKKEEKVRKNKKIDKKQ